MNALRVIELSIGLVYPPQETISKQIDGQVDYRLVHIGMPDLEHELRTQLRAGIIQEDLSAATAWAILNGYRKVANQSAVWVMVKSNRTPMRFLPDTAYRTDQRRAMLLSLLGQVLIGFSSRPYLNCSELCGQHDDNVLQDGYWQVGLHWRSRDEYAIRGRLQFDGFTPGLENRPPNGNTLIPFYEDVVAHA